MGKVTCLDESEANILTEEGDAADEELVEDDAHAPPVHRLAVTLPQNHLQNEYFKTKCLRKADLECTGCLRKIAR